jgi:hypothetical protein
MVLSPITFFRETRISVRIKKAMTKPETTTAVSANKLGKMAIRDPATTITKKSTELSANGLLPLTLTPGIPYFAKFSAADANR